MSAGYATTQEKVVHALPDMVFTLSRDGRYTGFLPGGDVGPLVPPEEFLGRSLEDVIGRRLAAKALACIGRSLDTNRVESFEYWLGSDKGYRLFEARMTPSANDEVVAVVRDVTDDRPGSKELAELRELLERACGALELAAPHLPRDSAADAAAAGTLGALYRAGIMGRLPPA